VPETLSLGLGDGPQVLGNQIPEAYDLSPKARLGEPIGDEPAWSMRDPMRTRALRYSRIIYTNSIVRKIVMALSSLRRSGPWAGLHGPFSCRPSLPDKRLLMLRPRVLHPPHAAELKANGIIHSEDAFILWHYLAPSPFRSRPGVSVRQTEEYYRRSTNPPGRGDVYFHTVIVPEGFTMFDILRGRFEAAGSVRARTS